MIVDQQALVDMFRQSFAPLVTLGAGRMALAQAQQERDYAARLEEKRRQQALQDHITGLRAQSEFQLQRERELQQMRNDAAEREAAFKHASGLAAVVAQQQTANEGALKNNLAIHEAQRSAKNVDEAAALARNLGLPIDQSAYGGDAPERFVQDVNFAAAGRRDEEQAKVDALAAERAAVLKRYNDTIANMQVPEEALAKRLVLGAASGDKKKMAQYDALSGDALMNKVSELGLDSQLEGLVAKRTQALEKQHGSKLADLKVELGGIQESLKNYERGPWGLRPSIADRPTGVGGAVAGDSGASANAEGAVGGVAFPPPPAGAVAPATGGGEAMGLVDALGLEGIAGLAQPGGQLRAALGARARAAEAGAIGGAATAATRTLQPLVRLALGRQAADNVQGVASAGALTAAVMPRLLSRSLTMDGLIKQASARGEIDAARDLRAKRAASPIDPALFGAQGDGPFLATDAEAQAAQGGGGNAFDRGRTFSPIYPELYQWLMNSGHMPAGGPLR